uniref:Uncharacterized protein n=1 Tax=Oryza brachyantha TaxID=4533 RepID=J3NC98_ORYBR
MGIERFKTSVDAEALETNEEEYNEGAEEKQTVDENLEELYDHVEANFGE